MISKIAQGRTQWVCFMLNVGSQSRINKIVIQNVDTQDQCINERYLLELLFISVLASSRSSATYKIQYINF